jgi:hypothetical protein
MGEENYRKANAQVADLISVLGDLFFVIPRE